MTCVTNVQFGSPRHERGRAGNRIVYGTTVGSSTLNFLHGQLSFMSRQGWDVHSVCSPDAEFARALHREGVTGHQIPMERDISPLQDALALIRWIKLLRQLRPDVVNIGTPKASLLGLLAARILRVPQRIYTVRGLRYQSESGNRRRLLIAMEWLTLSCATQAIAVSASVRDEMARDGLHIRPLILIGDGSSNGVETRPRRRRITRSELGLSETAYVIGFVGRLRPDKGAFTLTTAVKRIVDDAPNVQFLVIGDAENEDAEKELQSLSGHVRQTGWVDDPLSYYPLLDVLCLPTLREGFPNVVLEAAIAGVPTVTTTATGARDSVVHGKTGLIVPPSNPEKLADALLQLLHDNDLRRELGSQAEEWTLKRFPRHRIWEGLESIYSESNSSDVDVWQPPKGYTRKWLWRSLKRAQ